MDDKSGEGCRNPWVMVARNVTLRGSKGLLTARIATASSNPFLTGQALRFCRKGLNSDHRLLGVEHYRDKVVLQLEGIGSAPQAEILVGSDIFLQSKDLVDLPEGTYYIFRLVGLEVLGPGNRPLGRVVDVLRTGGTDLLLVQTEEDREILIPFTRSICLRVDVEAGCIEIDPPEGLLEIDAI
ncbi:MAG: 16S rRNA processing protein RimM [Acidobacteria bacterium]|nr:MAG: 16S rRNA processing protein RimM [Acidobacteriota bacterium]